MTTTELQNRIREIKREKDAIILCHYYQRKEIQEVSDIIGDSLALAQEAKRAKNKILVFCGVHFMAETAKILNPEKKVLIPDMTAGCYLADACEEKAFEEFKSKYPGYIVISYVNCSAKIKALSDIICTSGNAEKIVNSLPKDEKIIFAPDKNLGGYINRQTGRNMILWEGVCKVHNMLKKKDIEECKKQYPEAMVITHPECREEVIEVSDFVGSTKAMLKYISQSNNKQFIVVTEEGIFYEMERQIKDKQFIMVRHGEKKELLECKFMKQNKLEDLYNCLNSENSEIMLDAEIIKKASVPINRMLDISKQLGIIK